MSMLIPESTFMAYNTTLKKFWGSLVFQWISKDDLILHLVLLKSFFMSKLTKFSFLRILLTDIFCLNRKKINFDI